MRLTNKLWAGGLGLLVLTALGTLGYVWIERVSVLDALYMVAITITTVGFSEVFELSPPSRVLTIAIMVLGVGLALYTASAVVERLLDLGVERQRVRTRKLISEFTDHVIVCGFGRVGRGVYRDLVNRGEQVVIIEEDPLFAAEAETEGVPVLMGDATFNDTLEAAGIGRAKALVACVADDSDNLVIILSARSIHPTIHLVARANEQESESKLRLAGADRVVSPQVVGSERLAAMTVERNLAEVFDIVVGGRAVEFSVEELLVNKASPVVGRSIREAAIRERSGAMILAVEDQSRSMLHAPSPDHVMLPNSAVIVVGTADQVAAAAELFAG